MFMLARRARGFGGDVRLWGGSLVLGEEGRGGGDGLWTLDVEKHCSMEVSEGLEDRIWNEHGRTAFICSPALIRGLRWI